MNDNPIAPKVATENMSYLFHDPMGREIPQIAHTWLLASRQIAKGSNDPHTKVGAMVVNDRMEPLAVGCNNFHPDEDECFDNRQAKVAGIIYAEEGAVHACLRAGIPVRGCTILTTHYPSVREAEMAKRYGIKGFVVDHAGFTDRFVGNWRPQLLKARDIFMQNGIHVSGFPLPVEIAEVDQPQTSLVIPKGDFRTGYAVRHMDSLS